MNKIDNNKFVQNSILINHFIQNQMHILLAQLVAYPLSMLPSLPDDNEHRGQKLLHATSVCSKVQPRNGG